MTPRLLCVLVILVKMIFHSHGFYVNEVIKTTFRSQFVPKTHDWSGQKQEKITKTLRFHSMRATFDTYIVMCISYFD